MVPARRIVAIVALAALALTACSSNDAKESDIRDAMTDVGLSQGEADCVAGEMMTEFDQGELNDIASATDPADFPDGSAGPIDSILDNCVSGVDADTTDTDGDDSSDATDDTSDTSDADETAPTTAG
jgi:hypothetical protein